MPHGVVGRRTCERFGAVKNREGLRGRRGRRIGHVGAQHVVAVDRPERQEADSEEGQAQPQVPVLERVLADTERRFPCKCRQAMTRQQRAMNRELVSSQQGQPRVAAPVDIAEHRAGARRAPQHVPVPGDDDGVLSGGAGRACSGAERVGMQSVVGVQEDDVVGARQTKTGVSCSASPGAQARNHSGLDPMVACGRRPGVVRAIIHDDDVQGHARLLEERIERSDDGRGAVVHRDDDADRIDGHGGAPLTRLLICADRRRQAGATSGWTNA